MKPIVVVTGKNGQLGWELQQLASSFESRYDFVFADRTMLDMSQPETIAPFIAQCRPQYVLNCAAYTAVDKAESEQLEAMTINGISVGELATACEHHHCKLITISTDYVFDGNGTSPYQPDTPTDPVNYYGYSKCIGEQLAQKNNPSSIIVRTSWVYSEHGHNFVKTMLRLMKERPELKVVSDQVGSPTYAADLAAALMQIVEEDQRGNHRSGIYHYSNTGVISWYDFAVAIRDHAKLTANVLPIPGTAYPTPASRPAYSVMDTTKVQTDFGIILQPWEERLAQCLRHLV